MNYTSNMSNMILFYLQKFIQNIKQFLELFDPEIFALKKTKLNRLYTVKRALKFYTDIVSVTSKVPKNLFGYKNVI